MRFITALPTMTMAAAVFSLTAGAGVASADIPPGFPNLDSFTPVNVDNYVISMGRNGTQTSFTIGSGQYGCAFLNIAAGVDCNGQFPAVPAGIPTVGSPTPDAAVLVPHISPGADGAYKFTAQYKPGHSNYISQYSGVTGGNPVLPAGHKITNGTATCAAPDDASMACLDTANGKHGFILSPAGSSAF